MRAFDNKLQNAIQPMICAALIFFASTLPVAAQTLPNGLSFEPLVTLGLDSPTDFAELPDGRFLIIERDTGNLKLWVPQLGNQTALVGTIPNVLTGGERGLLSVCVDPSFVSNGFVYFWMTRIGSPGIELLRYECVGDLNDGLSADLVMTLATEHSLLSAVPDANFLHNGGAIRFGPDGMLYLSVGDDLAELDAQNSTILNGCILRLDVSSLPAGSGFAQISDLDPGDNPFSGSSSVEERLVLAFGLRNPFSFNIDPTNGDLFIADVGGSQRNELNQYVRGPGPLLDVNYGWPHREGLVAGPTPLPAGPPPTFDDPIDDRVHFVEGFTIIAGGIYRNQGGPLDWGPTYEGALFHSDFVLGEVERLEFSPFSSTWSTAAPIAGQPSPAHWASGFSGFVRFELGSDGGMYVLDYLTGRFGRIRPTIPENVMLAIGGENQVGMKGLRFGQTFDFRLEDVNGNPIIGATIKASSSQNSLIVGPDCLLTDGSGEVSFDIRAAGAGVITVSAQHLTSTASATAQSFARGLVVSYISGGSHDLLVVEFVNTSLGVNPIPTTFVAIPSTAPTVPTTFGLLAFDFLDVAQLVAVEDPSGIFGPANEFQGGYGTPGHTNVYVIPVGFLSGGLRFQSLWVDPLTYSSIVGITPAPLALSNIITINF